MFQKSTTKPLVKVASVFTALVLLAGCSTPAKTKAEKADSGPQPTADASIAKELLPFYEQKIDWKSCDAKGVTSYCGFVEVPTDWSKPAGGRLKIAIAYRKAEGSTPVGSLLLNPGGPGGSGVWMVNQTVYPVGTAELRKHFNLVGFDPRGVGGSEPEVICYKETPQVAPSEGSEEAAPSETSQAEPYQAPEPGSAEEEAQKRFTNKYYAQGCLEHTGPNLQFVDTISTARDMDVIRAVFGDPKINYLGSSYGTHLGNTYAALFPKRVGRMVLDSVLTSTGRNDKDLFALFLKGKEDAFNLFLKDCLGKSKATCPFTGDLESARSQVDKLLRSMEKKPLKSDSEYGLGVHQARGELLSATVSSWPKLRTALKSALKGDGTLLSKMSEARQSDPDSSSSFNSYASRAINCADTRVPTDSASLAAENKLILAAAPLFGRHAQFSSLDGCESWPFPAVKPLASYAAAGSDKILVIGSVDDPATPYRWAVDLATKVLANAQLVTFHGKIHIAYGRDNACINKTVDDYLIKGIVPTKDPQCK